MIYVEEEILAHPRTLQIQSRFPDAEVVPCSRSFSPSWAGP